MVRHRFTQKSELRIITESASSQKTSSLQREFNRHASFWAIKGERPLTPAISEDGGLVSLHGNGGHSVP
jgi:hypothetical protein